MLDFPARGSTEVISMSFLSLVPETKITFLLELLLLKLLKWTLFYLIVYKITEEWYIE